MGESSVGASGKFANWADEGSRGVAITGASGWVGRAIAHAVAAAMPRAGDLQLRLFGSADRRIEIAHGSFPLEALASAASLDAGREWLVVHLAVAGADREPDPDRRRILNDGFLQGAFRLAEGAQVRRFVSASSGAVHQTSGSPEQQAYAALKRDHEALARDWAARTATPLLLPRIFNLGGPYMNHAQRYALGDMILAARAGGPIRIAATRPVMRSYVHVLEFAEVVLDQALAEADEVLFETAGTEIVEMADLALAVVRTLGVDVDIQRPPMSSGGENRYLGDGRDYRAALAAMGAQPIGLAEIIRDTDVWLPRTS
jgi:nucleoside-diphosphate-sugar epimerase